MARGHNVILSRSITANYVSQLYVTAVGILILPLYIKYMGAEAYGLVGFFSMLQSWFALLDLGLTPTIGRETARYRGGAISALAYRQLFRALSLIFASIALIGGGGLWLCAEEIALRWLKVSELPISDVILAVQIMTIIVSLRWMSGLYRGVISGSERLLWLSAMNAMIATLRFIGVFASMWKFGFTPVVFFMHQLAVALLEIISLHLKSRTLLPRCNSIGWSIRPITAIFTFSLTIALTSSIWIAISQADKLILSGILPLAEYGQFSLAVLIASGVLIITTPISNIIMPLMTRLHAEKKDSEILQLYRKSTRVTSLLAGAAAITIGFAAEPILYAWTNDREIAKEAANVLKYYAIGNALMAVSAFPYYLQYALGTLRLHFIGNIASSIFLLPALIISSNTFGAEGAAYTWVIFNSIYLFIWTGYVHHKIKPGIHSGWIINDVLFAPACGIIGALIVGIPEFNISTHGRLESAWHALITGLAVAIFSVAASKDIYIILKKYYSDRK